MGQTGWFVELVNLAVPWGEFLIGMALLVGVVARLAVFFGAEQLLGFDALLEKHDANGEKLLERYSKLRYVLG